MIRLRQAFFLVPNQERKVKQGYRIEEPKQPIRPYRRMRGEEKEESNQASGKPLQKEQEQVPSPPNAAFLPLHPSHYDAYHQEENAARHGRQRETRLERFRVYIYNRGFLQYERTFFSIRTIVVFSNTSGRFSPFASRI